MTPRILIVGAGPAGLAAAAALAVRGLPARLIDRTGAAGGAYARMDPALVMTTPAALVGLPGLPAPRPAPYLTAAAYHRYLEAYAAHHRLAIEPAQVTAVTRRGRGYRVRIVSEDRTAPAGRSRPPTDVDVDVVILATGMFDSPVRPTLAGLPVDGPADASRPWVVHAGAWRTALARAGERVLIVGGASSAVEIAEACARAGAEVRVSVRDRLAIGPATILGRDPTALLMPLLARLVPALAPGFCAGRSTVPAADRGFAELRRAGRIAVVPAVAGFAGRTAILVDDRRLAVDVVILATGYRHPVAPAPRDLARDERGLPRTRAGESVSHPGLFVIGAPCSRRAASQYLYGMAQDAPALAAAIARRLEPRR